MQFEIGMEVVIFSSRGRSLRFTVGTVASVTASGRIVTLTDGRKFTGNGREYKRSGNDADRIEPLTERGRAWLAEQLVAD